MYRIVFTFALSAMLTLAMPAIAAAQSAHDPAVMVGMTHWQAGRFDTAVAAWRTPAERGDPEAQFRLAQALRDGQGIAPDPAKAEDLFGKAARQGHMEASDEYGVLLFQSARIKEALPWLQASAERGEPRARYYLGIASFNGDDMPKDWVRAYALMIRAATSGLEPAVAALKQMDESISLEDRRKAIVLAEDMEVIAREARSRHLASADLSAVPVQTSAPRLERATPAAANPIWPDSENVPAFATAPVSPAQTAPAQMAPAQMAPVRSSPVRPAPVVQPATPGKPAVAQPVPPKPTPPKPAAAKPVIAQSAAPISATAKSAMPKPAMPKPATPKPATPKPAEPKSLRVAKPVGKPAVLAKPAPHPAPVVTAKGKWRIQLGAFALKGNADALWARVRGTRALAGRKRFDVAAGPVIRLQSGPFANAGEARSACASLTIPCFVLSPP